MNDKTIVVANLYEAGVKGYNRMNGEVISPEGISSTIRANSGGRNEVKILEKQNPTEPVLVGGVGEINFGTQYRQGNRVYDSEGVAMALTSQPVGNAGGYTYLYRVEEPQAIRMVRTEEGKRLRKAYESGEIHHGFSEHKKMELREDGLANTLSTVQKDNYIAEPQVRVIGNYSPSGHEASRVVDVDGIYPAVKENHETVPAVCAQDKVEPQFRIRKLTPRECWRLMGFDDASFDRAAAVNSNSQLYKQAGNSIVVDVLMAIFKQML